MKTKFNKIVAAICIVATVSSVSVVGASALTRHLYGDINGDGVISMADANLVQQYLAGIVELDKYQKIAADVNADGVIDIDDVTDIQKLLAGYFDEFEAGKYFAY